MTNKVWKEFLESDRINNYDLETRLISIVSKPIKNYGCGCCYCCWFVQNKPEHFLSKKFRYKTFGLEFF